MFSNCLLDHEWQPTLCCTVSTHHTFSMAIPQALTPSCITWFYSASRPLLSSLSLAPRGSPFDMEGLRARLIMEKPERFGAPLTRKASPASPSPFHLYTSSLIMLHPSTHSPLHPSTPSSLHPFTSPSLYLSTRLPLHFMSLAPELILHSSTPPPTHSFTSPTLTPPPLHPSTLPSLYPLTPPPLHPPLHHSTTHSSTLPPPPLHPLTPPPTHIYPYPPRHLTLPSFPRDKRTKLPLCELAEDGAWHTEQPVCWTWLPRGRLLWDQYQLHTRRHQLWKDLPPGSLPIGKYHEYTFRANPPCSQLPRLLLLVVQL